MADPKIIALVNTTIKRSTMDSRNLLDSNKFPLAAGQELGINWYQPADNNHWEFELDSPKNGFFNWFAFALHVKIQDPDASNGQRILDAVNRVNAEQYYYQRRDITGDRIPETFCNWFAADVLDHLGVPVPRLDASAGPYIKPHPIYRLNTPFKPFSAEMLFDFFNGGGGGKWRNATKAQAVNNAKNGKAVVASAPEPFGGGQGHIAIVLPKGSASNIHIAQAGAVNSNDMSFEAGFGSRASFTKFFTYVG